MRRCNWCGVELRWWQINHCRRCGQAVRLNEPGPPCKSGSRWYEDPDGGIGWK